MVNEAIKHLVSEKFSSAGIDLSHNNRSGMRVKDPRFYEKVFKLGSLGLGESYMEGWWEADHVDEFIYDILKANLESFNKFSFQQIWHISKYLLFNRQSKSRALEVGKKHYDVGNDLFIKMLDKRMTYSCAYWKNASNLDQAQEAKLELICQKLYLKPGMRILDIGCGWGSFAKYAAEKHQAQVVGITISQQQLELAKTLCKGLPITLRFQDYRDVNEQFDRIVSIGQIEHVGDKNYRTYMQMASRCLQNDGVFLLHTIGSNKTTKSPDPWFEKYIFPNGLVPSAEQLTKAANGLFIFEDWHNFGAHYDKTLMAWHHNFVQHWDSLKIHYDERFYRMWTYYLLSCAAAFRSRDLQLWQIVFVKKGVPGGYVSIR
jgi:cyclopropane-fatty-acyl-phospholipid synthase